MTGNRLHLPSLIAMVVSCAFLVSFIPTLTAQSTGTCSLTVRVTGIRNTEGNIRVVLRRDRDTIVEAREVAIDAKTLTAQTVFDKLAEGTYGVAVMHDENKNGKLDMNEMGMPLEGYGHSNNPAQRMGPPSFDETKFAISHPGSSIEIRLIYWM